MKFQGNPGFEHLQADKVGVLVTNLGTPDAPTPSALKRYLKEFLSDPRVVEVTRWLWWLVLHGIILRIRPKRSAKAYRTVWTEEGSPLLINTRKQAHAIEQVLKSQGRGDIIVDYAMRYGNPSVSHVINNMLEQGVRKLLVLPLYPQYSAATTASAFDALAKDFVQRRWIPELRFITHYHDHPQYIKAIADHIREYWGEFGRADKLVLSYHGVPLRFFQQGDPYHCECHKTTRLIAEALDLKESQFITTFQSRIGRQQWLKPYTDETLKKMPEQGVRSVQVFCPGFSSDCLETIEEIGEENREYFLQAGGDQFGYIPALNDRPGHISALVSLITENIQGWSLQTDGQREDRSRSIQFNR